MKPLSEGSDVQATMLFLWVNLLALLQGLCKWSSMSKMKSLFSKDFMSVWSGWIAGTHPAGWGCYMMAPIYRRTGLLILVVYYSGWYILEGCLGALGYCFVHEKGEET